MGKHQTKDSKNILVQLNLAAMGHLTISLNESLSPIDSEQLLYQVPRAIETLLSEIGRIIAVFN